MTKVLATLAVLAVAGLAIAGCGSSGGGTTSSETASGEAGSSSSSSEGRYGEGSTTASASPEATGAAIVSATQTKAGKVIVDSKGMTLYDFHKDKGTTSSCYGGCAAVWPPMLSEGKPQAGEGAMGSKLGTTQRKDGTTQVTYAGHPLYTFIEDTKPGEANGNDYSSFGAQWYALKPSGEEAGD
jgi:predicted lipoprotein with Yx(FWY)xxD motif